MSDYYKIKDRISNSFLSAYKRKLMGMMPRTQNESQLRFGRGFHLLLLEPDKFNKYHFSPREYLTMMDMVKCVRDSVDPALFSGKIEHEYYYNYLNYRCKLKADIVTDVIVGDMKSTIAWDEFKFLSDAIKYDYPRQAAWYLDCPFIRNKGINTFVIWAVTKSKPFQLFTYSMHRDDEMVRQGRDEYIELIRAFDEDESEDTDRFKNDLLINISDQIPDRIE